MNTNMKLALNMCLGIAAGVSVGVFVIDPLAASLGFDTVNIV